jgi:ubiquinone/menaquinone biosynthesis C-methylase UbiE
MGQEIDMMRLYPKGKSRIGTRPDISDEDRRISKQFGFEYFDGDRRYGYGGFNYHPRFWTETVRLFRDHYHLAADASILDVGCAKGFMLTDFKVLMPEAKLAGIDVSAYAVEHAYPAVKDIVKAGDARQLPFPDRSFDLVIAINTLHNLKRAECVQALREVQRVSRGHAFIMVDGWHNEAEAKAMQDWVLTAETMMHADEWQKLFAEAGYTGDYFFWTVS